MAFYEKPKHSDDIWDISIYSKHSLIAPELLEKSFLPDTSPLHKKAIELVGGNYIIFNFDKKEDINNLKKQKEKEKASIFYLDDKLNVIEHSDLSRHSFVHVVMKAQ